jgi:hypothetical protein
MGAGKDLMWYARDANQTPDEAAASAREEIERVKQEEEEAMRVTFWNSFISCTNFLTMHRRFSECNGPLKRIVDYSIFSNDSVNLTCGLTSAFKEDIVFGTFEHSCSLPIVSQHAGCSGSRPKTR